jgi:hypothetical protein
MKKINPIWFIVLIALFAMSVIPGDGNKATSQQAIVDTTYTCTAAADCPTCVGAGIKTEDTEGYLAELNSKTCVGGVCQQSDACLVWDCGKAGGCNSIKQTILDNTIQKFNMYPFVLIGLIALLLVYKQLD